ncbi:MAG: nuclear transport factor 2 family protein [Ginsengibacter sp.]
MKTKIFCRQRIALLVLVLSSLHLLAQTEQQKLTATILHLDSAFWNAYNNCDTNHFKDFITDDIEFYHDKGGITIGAKSLIESLNQNICGNSDSRLRREAVAGTVKIFPMQNGDKIYGGIILGEHRFYLTEKGKPEYQSGVANFTQLWQQKNGTFKMSRILSYNHHEPERRSIMKEIELRAGQLDQLTGIYKSAQSGTMTIIRENKILILKGGGQSYKLYPQTVTSFFSKERDLVFQFVRDATGKPLKMVVKEHDIVADELVFEK